MRARARIIRLFAALTVGLWLPLLLSGCWDRIEIEERAFVLGIAVDLAAPEELSDDEGVTALKGVTPLPPGKPVRLTVQIALPGRIPLGPGEGGTSQDTEPVWVLHSAGRTIDDAVKVLQQEVADPLFFGHLRIIAISEKYARTGISNLNDYMRRNPEVRRRAWIAVTEGEADRFMDAAPEMERVPALYLLSTLDHAVAMGKYPNEFAGAFWIKTSSLGMEGSLPYLKIQEKDNVQIAGLAYFRDDRMVGATTPLEIGIYMGLVNSRKAGYSSHVRLPGSEETAMFRATYRKSKTKVGFRNGRPHALIEVMVEGNISEKSDESSVSLDSQPMLDEIGKELSARSVRNYETFIRTLQRDQSDIIGLGERFRALESRYWNREVKTKERWQHIFPSVSVEVKASVKVRRVGQKTR